MDIISKRDGPRPEDVKAKRMISENAGTIRKLADHISGGGYTRMHQTKARQQERPQAEGLLIHDLKAPAPIDDPQPYIKVSLNGRVVVVDQSTGRQLQMLGEIRRGVMTKRFVPATKENGYISPVDDATRDAILQLENVELTAEFAESELVQRLTECLGLNK